MRVEVNIHMPMDEVMASDRIAMMPQGVELVRSWDGGWRLANAGIVGGVMKPFLEYEVRNMIAMATSVIVIPNVNDDVAFIVKEPDKV